MTKNVNKKAIEEVSAAIHQLQEEGIMHPDYEQIQERMENNKKEKQEKAALKKRINSRKKAQKKQELEEAPDQITVDEITCESLKSIKKRLTEEFVRRINEQTGGIEVSKTDMPIRWKIGGILNEAADAKVCRLVADAAHIETTLRTRMQNFNKVIYFIEPFLEILDMAAEKGFQLRWYHILEALNTKSNDLCLYWLKVAIDNKMTVQELSRAIANNGDRKVKGRTRKASYLKAVKENVETHENLAIKGPKLMVTSEDIEPLDMPVEDFVAKLFTIVDTGYFNIRTIR